VDQLIGKAVSWLGGEDVGKLRDADSKRPMTRSTDHPIR
jgi:hypothetical protein